MVVCHPFLQTDGEGPYPHLLRRFLRHTDIRAPDLIGSGNGQTPQQIRIAFVLRVWNTGFGLLVHRCQPHQPHKAPDALSPNTPSKTR